MTQPVDPTSRRSALREATLEAAQRKRRGRLALWIGVGAVVAALTVGTTVLVNRPSDAAAATPSGAVTYPGLTRGHVGKVVTFAQVPPAGGDHAEAWQNCGVYTAPVPSENAVHSLEHGAIWVTYRPDLAADQVKTLQSAVKGQPYGLLSPFPDLPAPVVATVWGVQLKLQSASDPQLGDFIRKYADASLAPEPRGECTGGVGTPRQ